MSSLLRRIAAFSARRRLLVIGVWLVLLLGLGFAGHAAGTKYSSSITVSGSDSAAANDVNMLVNTGGGLRSVERAVITVERPPAAVRAPPRSSSGPRC